MQYKIINEQPWQILTDAMTISPSETGYELQVAADGKNYTTLFSVGPGITRQITNLSSGSYFRMKGNVGEVTVNWVRSCNSGGSGGGGNAGELEPVSEFPVGVPEGTVVALASGDTVGVYQYDGSEWIPVAGGDMSNYYTKAQTDAAITAATEDMATKTWVGQQGYLTEHQDISGKLDVSTFNTYTGATETVLEGKADISDIPDVSDFVTSGEVATQIGTAMAAETARTESTYLKEHQDISGKLDKTDFNTYTGATETALNGKVDLTTYTAYTGSTATAIAAKQDALVSGTNIKTINNQSLLGSGNIDIQGGGGGTTYTAGDYISIAEDVISVTGITPDLYLTSADTQNLASEDYVDAAITAATENLASKSYVDATITAATASETARTENTYAKIADIPSLDGYWTSAQTEDAITAATYPFQSQLDDIERVTATAYTELHQDIVALSGATSGYATHAEVTAATANMATQAYVTGITSPMQTTINTKVTGDGISTIKSITQSAYDALVAGGTVDANTFYVITGSTS